MKLEDILHEEDEITDPVSMESIRKYLDRLRSQDNDFMQLLIKRVGKETIRWPQPWYQRVQCLTRRLERDKPNEPETFRTGTFSKAETELMKRNWKAFIKIFKLPNTPIRLARWRNRNKSRNRSLSIEEQARHFVMAYLARGLKRNLNQVYMRFVAHYGAPRKGRFSKLEERAMEICFHHKPNKAVTYLTDILGREARGISKRINMMRNGEDPVYKRTKWTLPLASKFLKSLMKHSGLPLESLKNATFATSVWRKVQRDMDHDYRYLQYQWHTYLHVQLFVKYDVRLTRIRKKVFKSIQLSPYEVWPDIRWKDLVKRFPDGFTHMFLYQCVFKLIHKFKGYRRAPLQAVVDYGLHNLKSGRINQKKRLRTLELNSKGELVRIRHTENMP